MKRRSQISIPLYMISAIIIIVILFVSMRTISNFRERERRAVAVELKEKLKTSVESTSIKAGSVTKDSFDLPSNTNEVCLFDLSKTDVILKSPILDRYPVMGDSISSGAKKNVFIIIKNKVWDSMYAGDICFDHYPYYLCYKTLKNKLDLEFEGKGKCAMVREEFRRSAQSRVDENGQLTEEISMESLAGDLTLNIPASVTVTSTGLIDSDSDGLSDQQERTLGLNPSNPDYDNDGIRDGIEVLLGTDPKNPDSDNDGFLDGAEVNSGSDPKDNTSKPTDADGDGMDDEWEIRFGLPPEDDKDDDPDNDGLTNYEEYVLGINPREPDTDGDGISDWEEVKTYLTDPSEPDTDKDGITDREEITSGTNPLSPSVTSLDIYLEPMEFPEEGAFLSEVYNIYSTQGEVSFSEPITIKMSYYPELIPEGFNEDYIKIKYYDASTGEWVKAETVTINKIENTITAEISVLAPVAVFGPDPPTAIISSPTPPAIFLENTDISFDASSSFDLDNDPLTFLWNFGDGSTSNRKTITHSYSKPGYYNVMLRVNDGYSDDEKSITVHINSDNRKDDSKYSEGMIFLVREDDWRTITRLIPLTIWNDGSLVPKRYPLIAFYEKTALTNEKLNKLLLEYSSNKAVFAGTAPLTDPRASSMADYFSYWQEYYKDVVVIDYNNMDGALIAALFASFLNAPLIMVNGANLNQYESELNYKNVYIVDSLEASVMSYINTNAKSSVRYTSSILKTDTAVNPYALLNASIFVAE